MDYGNLPSLVGIRPLIQQFRAFSQLTELVPLLNNPFTIAYLDTIKLLETISKMPQILPNLQLDIYEGTMNQLLIKVDGSCIRAVLVENC